MHRQYGAGRCRGGPNPLRVGTIPAGAVFYLQDEGWWRDPYHGAPVCRDPVIVEAFLNGQVGASRLNRDTGLWESAYAAGRSDIAVVRSLRDGRRRTVAVRVLVLHEEHGLVLEPVAYPSLPDLRFHPAWRRFVVCSVPVATTQESKTHADLSRHRDLPRRVACHGLHAPG